jgi:hypothetical protein
MFPSVDFHLHDSVPPDKSAASNDKVPAGGTAKDTALNGATGLRILMRCPSLLINRHWESTRMC